MNTSEFTQLKQCVDAILAFAGDDIRLGIPLGIGKPNHLVNAIYKRAVENPSIQLTIYTALTLEKPKGKSLLEKRFLEPMAERLFGSYPDLRYELDRLNNRLPSNIKVIEFYFPAGKYVGNARAQRDYMSTNYTHVARDLIDRKVNVIAQLVSPSENGQRVSLSCNPDVSLDLMMELEGQSAIFVGQVTRNLPYMYGDADIPRSSFDVILDNPEYDYPLFAPPKSSVSNADYMIGLYASCLVKDGGELQVGIGALGDALIYGLLLRHRQNDQYQAVLNAFQVQDKFGEILHRKGGKEPFEEGLFGASEMLVDGFMHLMKHGIMRREVFDHPILQRLINDEQIDPQEITGDTLRLLLANGAFEAQLEQEDFDFLKYFGILRSDLQYRHGQIEFADGTKIEADLNIDLSQSTLIEKGLGLKLTNGAVIHGGFFLGASDFYEWLKEMPDEEKRKIHMKSVRSINQLYGHEYLDRLHRIDGRFFNTCLMMTLLGAAVSDGLENGEVVSGVGGQYNFVEMAHALPDGHSVIQLRSTRTSKGKVSSNIVWNYGHITIPRHLKDIVITEYGIADIRGKTDEEVIIELVKIADSRFQENLIEQAKRNGKLSQDFMLSEQYKNNLPATIVEYLKDFKSLDLFPAFPFGTDLTDEELVLGKALKSLKRKTATKFGALIAIIKAIFSFTKSDSVQPLLQRMQLAQTNGLMEWMYKRLLVKELS